MNDYQIKMASQLIEQLKSNGVACREMSSPKLMISMIQRMLKNQKGNLYDVEDVLNQLLYAYSVWGYTVSPAKSVKLILRDYIGKRNEHTPIFEDLPGRTQDDILDGAEVVSNDMSQVEGFEPVPGKDLHVAIVDVQDRLGLGEMLEFMIAGESEEDIASKLRMSRDQVKRRKLQIRTFLNSNGYFGG